MSVHGALNNAVSGQLIDEVLQDSLSALTRTACFIKSLAKPVMGPAGNDIDIVHKLNTNRSGAYRGSPVILDVQKDDHYTGTKALWTTNFADVVIEGDELQNNIGMNTREIMEGASLPDTPQNRNRVVALFSIAKENMRGAVTSMQNQLSDATLDQLVGENFETNGYEGLPTVLDPTAELHGLTPNGLGSFHATRNPWRSDPPNNQTTGHLYKNVPQVYTWPSGTTITSYKHDVIDRMMIKMSVIPGYWICPCGYAQWRQLIASDQENDMIPKTIGFNKWKNSISVIEYNRGLFYYDGGVPDTEVWGIHVGMLDGVEKGMGAGFQMCEWVPPSLVDRMENIQMMMMKPTNPTSMTDMTMDDNNVLAMWLNEFTRDDTRPDSIYSRAFTKSSFVTHYRWKNFKIDALPTT